MPILNDIRTALDTRLKALLPDDVAWENVKYEPRINHPWYQTKMLWSRSVTVGAGQKGLRQHIGIYQVSVMVPPGTSIANAMTRADAVRAHFDHSLTLDYGAAHVLMQLPYVGPSINDGTWVNVPVSCPWNCYEKP